MSNCEDKRFIYVFNEADKDLMLKYGYVLITQVPKNGIYVFLADSENTKKFSAMPNIKCYFSNTLTF